MRAERRSRGEEMAPRRLPSGADGHPAAGDERAGGDQGDSPTGAAEWHWGLLQDGIGPVERFVDDGRVDVDVEPDATEEGGRLGEPVLVQEPGHHCGIDGQQLAERPPRGVGCWLQ